MVKMTTEIKKILIDCDPGTDDSMALMYAIKHPALDLKAVTAVSGNLTVDITCKNALSILEFMGVEDVPVAQGMMHPLVRNHPKDPYSHGTDGLGNHFFPEPKLRKSDLFAPDLIIETVLKYPHEISIAAIGPLTNIALAFQKKPEIVPLIKELYHLGGAFGFTEYAFINATGDNPISEWNIYVDPEAADIVYKSGVNLTAIGLDCAYHPNINLQEQHFQMLAASKAKEAKYMHEILEFVMGGSFDSSSGTMDPIAIAAIIDPSILTTEQIKVAIEKDSPLTRGMTVWDRRDHFRNEDLVTINAVSKIDAEKYLQSFIGTMSR